MILSSTKQKECQMEGCSEIATKFFLTSRKFNKEFYICDKCLAKFQSEISQKPPKSVLNPFSPKRIIR